MGSNILVLLTADLESVVQNLNIIWAMSAVLLIFFMQAGFILLETGFTRAKNASSIIMKNLIGYAIGSLGFYAAGFALMYGGDNPYIGTSGFLDALRTAGTSVSAYFTAYTPGVFVLFQIVLCGMATAIVSGAMAERTKLLAYLIYSLFISLILYPVIGHWIWNSKGWLASMGFHDYAGSTLINCVGGWCALLGAWAVGPRTGKYRKEGKSLAIPGHNIVISALGVFILWFAWFGLNNGISLQGGRDMGAIALNTNLSACASAIAVWIITRFRYGKPDVSMTLNGVLAGLVAISAGCDLVGTWESVIIGALAGTALVFSIEFVERVLKVDDPVGAVSVHLTGGILGTVLAGILAGGEKLEELAMSRAQLIGIQVLGVIAVGIAASAGAFLILFLIKKTLGLRITRQEEEMGLDISEHGINSYNDFPIKL